MFGNLFTKFRKSPKAGDIITYKIMDYTGRWSTEKGTISYVAKLTNKEGTVTRYIVSGNWVPPENVEKILEVSKK